MHRYWDKVNDGWVYDEDHDVMRAPETEKEEQSELGEEKNLVLLLSSLS